MNVGVVIALTWFVECDCSLSGNLCWLQAPTCIHKCYGNVKKYHSMLFYAVSEAVTDCVLSQHSLI